MENNNLKDFYFSYSSVNAFETCPYQFKLVYIDKQNRIGNFFSDYGSFVHEVIKKYFSDELEIYELYDYYQDNFADNVKILPPDFMLSVLDNYYDAGLKFFRNFDFNKDKYESISLEKFIRGNDCGINVIIKPDLILRNKKTGEITIIDFKTSEIKSKNGKIDEKKLKGYKDQLNLYIQYIYFFKDIEIKKARLLFIRSNTSVEWEFDPYEAVDVLFWFVETAKKIQKETRWEYNNNNKFMCSVLCNVRNICQYNPKEM